MGWGHKKCAKCGHETGPRSFACPACGEAFEIKSKDTNGIREVIKEDGTVVYKTKRKIRRSTKPKVDLVRFANRFGRLDGDIEEARLADTIYPDMETWVSRDGLYKIRYTPVVHGIRFGGDNSYGEFVLLHRDSDEWKVLHIGKSGYGRFKSLDIAIKMCCKYHKRYHPEDPI